LLDLEMKRHDVCTVNYACSPTTVSRRGENKQFDVKIMINLRGIKKESVPIPWTKLHVASAPQPLPILKTFVSYQLKMSKCTVNVVYTYYLTWQKYLYIYTLCIYFDKNMHIYTYVYIYIHIHIHVYTCLYIYICVNIFVYTYIYIYIKKIIWAHRPSIKGHKPVFMIITSIIIIIYI